MKGFELPWFANRGSRGHINAQDRCTLGRFLVFETAIYAQVVDTRRPRWNPDNLPARGQNVEFDRGRGGPEHESNTRWFGFNHRQLRVGRLRASLGGKSVRQEPKLRWLELDTASQKRLVDLRGRHEIVSWHRSVAFRFVFVLRPALEQGIEAIDIAPPGKFCVRGAVTEAPGQFQQGKAQHE